MDRWRKPAGIIDAVEGDTLVLMPSGEVMVDANVAVDAETLARMFAGYVCANCLEPQEIPFPEICEALKTPDGKVVGCYYRIRDNQLRHLNMKHGSLEEVHVGSRINMADEAERLREMDAYEARTGITLPDDVKFPTTTFKNGKEVVD